MKKIREWWYAYLVCCKYNLEWNFFVKLGYGHYNWTTKSVAVNPLSENFMSIFMHEVGHHVHHMRVDYDKFLPSTEYSELIEGGKGWDVFKSLEAEWWASRYAAKTGKVSRDHLTKSFNTYTANIFSSSHKEGVSCHIGSVIGASHKGWLKINK